MKLPEKYKDWTIEDLLEGRTSILARPFPEGYSQEEGQMIDWLENHCANHFMEALEEVRAWQASYDEWLRADDPDTVEFPDSHALIKKLEAVE